MPRESGANGISGTNWIGGVGQKWIGGTSDTSAMSGK